MEPLHCSFPSAAEAVAAARQAVASYARAARFRESDVFDVGLAAGELCTNAVEHGHRHNATFSVDCWFEGDTLTVCVRDSGGRDRILPEKDDVGGLGLFLVRSLSDSLTFDCGSDGTRVQFTKRRNPIEGSAQ